MNKEQWVNEKKNNKSLVWIDSPRDSDKSPVQVASELWYMYDSDFNLSISNICDILLCDRNWVVKNVQDNVKHIFINNTMRLFMNKIDSNRDVLLKDYYYFSRTDFYRWLMDNTKMERQTMIIDMMNYAYDKSVLAALIRKYENDKKNATSMLELGGIITAFNHDVYECVNDKGKAIYSSRQREDKRNCEFVSVSGELPKEFTSLKLLKEAYKNNERVYRSLFSAGAIKYTICNSLVRFDKDYMNIKRGEFDVIVPYSNYMFMK